MSEVKPPEILVRDRAFLIIDKPMGLPVHPGRAGGASVEDFFQRWRRGRQGPWLAHRLDQDTSGCLVIALKKAFLLEAQALFAAGAVQKTYWAVVRGVPGEAAGVIDASLAKHTEERSWKMVPDPAGQTAVTEWRVLGGAGDMSLLEFHPKTGRTHQIRAHAAVAGAPDYRRCRIWWRGGGDAAAGPCHQPADHTACRGHGAGAGAYGSECGGLRWSALTSPPAIMCATRNSRTGGWGRCRAPLATG